MKTSFKLALGVIACLAFSLSTTSADTITWQSSVDLFQGTTTDTFVNNSGVSGFGYINTTDTALGPITLNGVVFTSANTGNALANGANGESITINGGTDNENAFGDGQFSSNGDIFNVLRGATFNTNSVTLDGLVQGNDYLIQVFTHDGRGSRNNNFITGFGDGNNSTAPVGFSELSNSGNTDPNSGGTGDSIIGTFSATGPITTFNLFGSNNAGTSFGSGNSQSQINAIQLRDLGPTPVVVPEPSSLVVLSFGSLLLLNRRRR